MIDLEQQWRLIACGMVAHADDILEVGEWESLLRLVGDEMEGDELDHWLGLLTDRAQVEAQFASLELPDPSTHLKIVDECWRMALADGHGSQVEAAVHDRIADRLGVGAGVAAKMREEMTLRAGERAEVVVAFAAAMANLDGHMDTAEAVAFDELLSRLPLPVSRRLELAPTLYDPPALEDIGARLATLPEVEREQALVELAPFVRASRRGDRERTLFVALATRAGLDAAVAKRILDA